MFGYVSGMTLAVPRMLFAFGRDGFLPRQLAAVHPRFRTPYVAIVVQTIVVIVLAVTGSFETAGGDRERIDSARLRARAASPVIQLRRRDVRAGGDAVPRAVRRRRSDARRSR